ncbi:MAG: hypothetical protein SWH54_15850 [Thermodesulfobacteriota bacterium]|nr:hypothetical protein [Thermodesulfobacteriota bacterium]
MNEVFCKLCNAPLLNDKEELCEVCQKMEVRINYLIERHKEAIREYLGKKFNETSDPKLQMYERRSKEYTPPKGTHTPDRRKKIRRLKQLKNHPQQRKSDRLDL